jgi:hypothetical protein
MEVVGLPPAKDQSMSVMGAKHQHLDRVILLLKAAQAKIETSGFSVLSGPVGLEVVLSVPPGNNPWDAINYLGGIADVLEVKSKREPEIKHLGELAHTALYENDRQIREVHYCQRTAPQSKYSVRVWALQGSSDHQA